ncbi:hypothetical protein SO802_005362 [Lithocarpus litseifolius]|uniref:Malectin-like domain-containing protein n=1 Tax=Lithocarpus litseifolius TaxID=425828 RepID=A0AAW2DL60_9ROSI
MENIKERSSAKDRQWGGDSDEDKDLIDTGIVKTVSPDSPEDLPQSQKNLRSFPQGTRNCYTLRPEQGKNNNYLIKARFVYGNYDGENQTPKFDLHLEVNEWTTVNLTNFGAYGYYYDIIHVPLSDKHWPWGTLHFSIGTTGFGQFRLSSSGQGTSERTGI